MVSKLKIIFPAALVLAIAAGTFLPDLLDLPRGQVQNALLIALLPLCLFVGYKMPWSEEPVQPKEGPSNKNGS